MKKGLFYFIFRDKPAKALIALLAGPRPTYASNLAKAIDCTYPHMVRLLSEFKKEGLVKISSAGRIKPVTLTPKGKRISARLRDFAELCEQD